MDVYHCINCDFIDQLDHAGRCRACGSTATTHYMTISNHGKATTNLLDFINGQHFRNLTQEELRLLNAAASGRMGVA
jgi:hypothetical protein